MKRLRGGQLKWRWFGDVGVLCFGLGVSVLAGMAAKTSPAWAIIMLALTVCGALLMVLHTLSDVDGDSS